MMPFGAGSSSGDEVLLRRLEGFAEEWPQDMRAHGNRQPATPRSYVLISQPLQWQSYRERMPLSGELVRSPLEGQPGKGFCFLPSLIL